jgi:hypothetical protein
MAYYLIASLVSNGGSIIAVDGLPNIEPFFLRPNEWSDVPRWGTDVDAIQTLRPMRIPIFRCHFAAAVVFQLRQ